MIKLVVLFLAIACLDRTLAQYGSSYSAPSYSSPSSYSSSGYAASPAMQSSSASIYPSINLPLLNFPAILGNATLNTATRTSNTTTSSIIVSRTNFLSSLPSSAISNISPDSYAFGVYANDFDASRDTYYGPNREAIFNQYTTNLTGFGALNLSNPVAVAAANWWSPYPYQLAAWNDGFTTQNPSSTTAASASGTVSSGLISQANILNSSLYYAAYAGNIAGLGVPGLGLSVPGQAPNVSAIVPGLRFSYNVASTVTTAAPAMSSYSSGYSSAPARGYSSGYSAPMASYASPSPAYGR